MDELIAWLRAQLDDDERLALTFEVREGEWRCQHCAGAMTSAERLDSHLFETGHREWGPARVLAEVNAKRHLIAGYEGADEFYGRVQQAPAGEITGLYAAIQYAALPYADRPGYKESWRP